MNICTIIGRVGRGPELRTTTTGKEVASFSVAVADQFNKEKTDWFNVVVWGKTAEFVEKYVMKGARVGVSGRLSTKTWTDKEGTARKDVELVANDVTPIDWPSGGDEQSVPADEWDDPFAE